MEPPIRALFTVCEMQGKYVVSAEIPSADYSSRPVFYRGAGRIRGSYVRVGESDEPMSEYEVYCYEAFRKRIRDELRTCETNNALLDTARLDEYITLVKQEKTNLSSNFSDSEIQEFMGITQNHAMTVAGIMVFFKYPQAYYPQLCITAVSVTAEVMGESGTSQERFIDNARLTGAIPEMLNSAVDFVRRNSRIRTIIDDSGKRTDKPEYPIVAVREAILNALVHRDYSLYSENTPIRIEMYRDRLEIINPGALYGRMKLGELGVVRPETRNPALAGMLEIMRITENRYSGIPTIRHALQKAGLPAPEFSVLHGEFRVIMRNDYILVPNTTQGILQFCSTPRSREELTQFTGKSRNYTMKYIIQPLVESGQLRLTLPEKPKSPLQRYVTAGI